MYLYYAVQVCWSDYVCVENHGPKWSVITVWWKKYIYSYADEMHMPILSDV